MLKKADCTPATSADSMANHASLRNRQKEQVREAIGRLRGFDLADRLDLVAFLEYCSYVSANADTLGIEEFDTRYSIDEVSHNLGNEYLATDFVEYYAGLCSTNPALPDLRGITFRTNDLSKAIFSSVTLGTISSNFMVDNDGMVALSTWFSLAGFYSSDVMEKQELELCSAPSIANLVVRLADVGGMSVLDFACGDGIYLSTALVNGASSICGRDINDRAVMRAKILCFFANTTAPSGIAVANALSSAPSIASAQRVVVAPPLGVRLKAFDIQEKDYYTNVVSSLVGERTLGEIDFEDFCAAKALASLSDDGKAIIHVSSSFLFRQQKSRQTIRRAIIEDGYLRTVIELPGGCISGARMKSALLIIEKEPTDEGVLIVDLDSKDLADKGYVSKGRGRCEITEAGIDWLAKTVEQRDEIPLVSTVAARERILASGSNLCYSTYGDVFDYDSILAETRSAKDIMDDIKAAQASIDSLGEQIADILNSIEKKG